MDGIVVALMFGCVIGLFVGARVLRSPQPHITVVQFETHGPRRKGCLLAVVIAIIFIAVALTIVT